MYSKVWSNADKKDPWKWPLKINVIFCPPKIPALSPQRGHFKFPPPSFTRLTKLVALLHEVKSISDETFINKMIKKKTHLGSDLVAALAGLNVDDFSHVGWCSCALQVPPLASSVFPREYWTDDHALIQGPVERWIVVMDFPTYLPLTKLKNNDKRKEDSLTRFSRAANDLNGQSIGP